MVVECVLFRLRAGISDAAIDPATSRMRHYTVVAETERE